MDTVLLFKTSLCPVRVFLSCCTSPGSNRQYKDSTMRKIITVALLSLTVSVSAGAAAEKSSGNIVYRWVDENGSVHYSPTKPWGVKYESVNTNYSAQQREMIDESNKAKETHDRLMNKDQIKNEEEKAWKDRQERLQLCIDTTFDKMSYQKRRIEDDSVKQKLDCEYTFSRAKQKSKYDDCILKIESERIEKVSQLEQSINQCIDADTPKKMIQEVMEKHRENEERKNAIANGQQEK